MAVRVEFLAPARRELEDAFQWYSKRSRRAASNFLREIERAIGLIAEAPNVWPFFEAGTRRYPLRKYPYNVIFGILAPELRSLRLLTRNDGPDTGTIVNQESPASLPPEIVRRRS